MFCLYRHWNAYDFMYCAYFLILASVFSEFAYALTTCNTSVSILTVRALVFVPDSIPVADVEINPQEAA